MKVKSIAECSLGAFCNTFDLHLAINGVGRLEGTPEPPLDPPLRSAGFEICINSMVCCGGTFFLALQFTGSIGNSS